MTSPPDERCPQCGETERHAFECPVSVASREEFNAALREYVPKSAEPAAPVCTACENGKCGGNFGCIKLDACASRKPAKAPQSDGTLDSLTGQMRPERSEYNRMSKAYDELQALLRADELRVREYAEEVGRLKSAIAYAIEKSYPVVAERIQEIARGEG